MNETIYIMGLFLAALWAAGIGYYFARKTKKPAPGIGSRG